MKNLKITSIMIPISNYPVVRPNSTLEEAVTLLRYAHCELERGICTEAGPNTVLVIDEEKGLVGILDFKAILKVLIPEVAGGLPDKLSLLGVSLAFAEGDAHSLDETSASFLARVRKNAKARVKDIMLKIKGTIQAETSLIDALKLLFKNKITMLPVYEGDNIIGIVRDTDLFLAVADILYED